MGVERRAAVHVDCTGDTTSAATAQWANITTDGGGLGTYV